MHTLHTYIHAGIHTYIYTYIHTYKINPRQTQDDYTTNPSTPSSSYKIYAPTQTLIRATEELSIVR